MIRRNHIDNGCKVDRDCLRSRPRPASQVPSSTPIPRRVSPELADQNMRIISNNKKYHQYKEERESKQKPVHQFREVSKPITPLAETNLNSDFRGDNGLKREYTYDLEDTLKIDYNSISLKPHQPQQKRAVQPLQKDNDNCDSASNRQNFKMQANSYNPSLERTLTLPSPARRPSYQVNMDSANSKTFTPLFEETSLALKKKELEQSSTRRQTEMGRIYDPSSKKIVKTDYEITRVEPNTRKNSMADYNRSINKYAPTSNNITNYSSAHSYSTSKPIPADTFQNKDPILFKAPSLPPSYHQQQVSQKLRMISDFNDQINERIKNIIGCFQGLKNKL